MNSKFAALNSNAIEIVGTFGTKPILVLGDVMVDSYVEGGVSRISPEAPVPVLANPSEERFAIGGAGNVAHNLVTLGNPTVFVSGYGINSETKEKDSAAGVLTELLEKTGISSKFLVPLDRKTTLKKRILSGKQQLLRIDIEDTKALSPDEEQRILKSLKEACKGIGAIIISDYAKGLLTEKISKELSAYAEKEKIPLLVDAKFRNLDKLSKISLLKPNLKEAQEFTGIIFTGDILEIKKMAEVLNSKYSCAILITCGHLGMVLHDGNEVIHLQGQKKEVFDVSGAGDAVIAAIAHGVVRGLTFEESASFATFAAGIAVSHQGTTPVRIAEIEADLRKIVYPKTWGHEEWIVNSDYCGKKLVLNEGHCCSLHYHKIKDETFYIASGKVGFQMNDKYFILMPGDSLLITPGTKHRFYGLENSEIFEFSTHHMEDDSYRDEVSGTFEKSFFEKIPQYRSLMKS